MEDLQKRIGYTFKNTDLLTEALTHSSYANEHKAKHIKYNERLEFHRKCRRQGYSERSV